MRCVTICGASSALCRSFLAPSVRYVSFWRLECVICHNFWFFERVMSIFFSTLSALFVTVFGASSVLCAAIFWRLECVMCHTFLAHQVCYVSLFLAPRVRYMSQVFGASSGLCHNLWRLQCVYLSHDPGGSSRRMYTPPVINHYCFFRSVHYSPLTF